MYIGIERGSLSRANEFVREMRLISGVRCGAVYSLLFEFSLVAARVDCRAGSLFGCKRGRDGRY